MLYWIIILAGIVNQYWKLRHLKCNIQLVTVQNNAIGRLKIKKFFHYAYFYFHDLTLDIDFPNTISAFPVCVCSSSSPDPKLQRFSFGVKSKI